MPTFVVTHDAAAGSDLPIINVTGSAAQRLALCYLSLGSSATPGDTAGKFVVERTTDVGTGGTALTERAPDQATATAPTPVGAAVGGTFGTPPTDTANSEMLSIGLNQRATFQWVPATDRHRIWSLAVASNGLMVNCDSHTATPNINCTLWWDE